MGQYNPNDTDYQNRVTPQTFDSEVGSLRKINAELNNAVVALRRANPNTFTPASVQTAATGSNYTALTSAAGTRITGLNATGTSLTFRRVGTPAVTFAFASAATVDLPLTANANEWEVKRTDDSNTQVTLAYLLHSFVA